MVMKHYKQYFIVTENEMNQHSDSQYDSVRASDARAMARRSSALTGTRPRPAFLQNPDRIEVPNVETANNTNEPATPLTETSAQKSTDIVQEDIVIMSQKKKLRRAMSRLRMALSASKGDSFAVFKSAMTRTKADSEKKIRLRDLDESGWFEYFND